jgi:hypothetical protein
MALGTIGMGTRRRHGVIASTFIPLIALATTTAAQQLQFTEPAANALTALGASLNYTAGESVRIAWQTDFEYTTLRLWQGPLDDGSYVSRVLAANYTQDRTSLNWDAARIGDTPYSRPLYFELTDGHDEGCEEACTSADSLAFYISRAATSSSTSRSSTTSSQSSTLAGTFATSTSSTALSSTTSATSTDDVAGAAITNSVSSTPSTSDDRKAGSDHKSLAIGLGVGLGVGLAALFALIGILIFCCLRRRDRERAGSLPRGNQPVISRPMAEQPQRASDQQPILSPSATYNGIYRPNQTFRSSASTAHSTASSRHGPFPFEEYDHENFETRSVMSEMDRQSRGGYATPSRGSANGSSMRTMTPSNGGRRLPSIDEHAAPRAPPVEWPLR